MRVIERIRVLFGISEEKEKKIPNNSKENKEQEKLEKQKKEDDEFVVLHTMGLF